MKPGKLVTIDEEGISCIECGKDFDLGEKALEEYEGMLCLQCDIEEWIDDGDTERPMGFGFE